MNRLGRLREPAPDVLAYIKKLEQRIKNLETNARAGHTSVDIGGLAVNVTGDDAFEISIDGIVRFRVTSDDIRYLRPNGLTAWFLTEFSNNHIVGFQDNAFHTIMGDDAISGWGLARPWLTVPFYDAPSFTPARTTTSGTFVDLQYAKYNIQHPYFKVTSHVQTSDGTTGGEIVMRVNAEQVDTTVTTIPVGSATSFEQTLYFASYGLEFGTDCEITIAARRTAGAGTIGVRTVQAYGRETPI